MSRKKPQSAMAALLDFTEASDEKPRIPIPENAWENARIQSTELDTMNAYSKAFTKEFMPHLTSKNETVLNQLISLDPNDCILWRFSDRPSDELGDIDSLARSLKEHGQQEPILVRENQQKTQHAYEIIFGNRRWRAAQIAKVPLIAICKVLSDQQAALFQKEENENRKELSDYARAMSYRSQIDGGVFKNESELSKTLGISKQALNDLMAYLRVPEELRESISNYKSLSKKMVTKLAALSKDSDILDVLLHLAPKISDNSVTTSTIDKHIQSFLSPGLKKNRVSAQLTYEKKDDRGRVVFKTKHHDNGDVSVHLNRGIIHTQRIELLHAKFSIFLEDFLREE